MEQGLIQRAIVFAQKKHEGQFRKDGTPYIIHPLRVSGIVKQFKRSHRINELIAAAILHDTLEDTNTGIAELRDNFGELISLLVIELTSDRYKINQMGKTAYLTNKLCSSKDISKWALVIKLADRLDNVSDLNNIPDKDFVMRYKHETEEIMKYLEKNRELSPTHKRLIEAIKEKLQEIK